MKDKTMLKWIKGNPVMRVALLAFVGITLVLVANVGFGWF